MREQHIRRALVVHQTFVSSPSDVQQGVLDPFNTRTVDVQDALLKCLFNHAIYLKMFCKSSGAQVFRRLRTTNADRMLNAC